MAKGVDMNVLETVLFAEFGEPAGEGRGVEPAARSIREQLSGFFPQAADILFLRVLPVLIPPEHIEDAVGHTDIAY